jgi:hypothetical protein
MRFLFALAIAASAIACANEYHPEYHPVTTTTYTQSVGSPAVVQAAPQQVVYAAPPPTMQAPPPPPPPQPPPGWPW